MIGTVSRLLAHIEAGHVSLRDSLEILVIDEADLIFSFGYEDDLKKLIKSVYIKASNIHDMSAIYYSVYLVTSLKSINHS